MPTSEARHADLLRYRDEFPLLSASVYLNTCSLGARSERSRQRLDAVLEQWDRLGGRAWYRHWLDELSGLRDDLGWTIGAPGDQVALTPNVSVGLATVASAIDPVHRGEAETLARLRDAGLVVGSSPRPKVVITDLDFPTVGHQWLARERLGVEVSVVRSTDGLTVPLETLAAAIDERTALVATSHVYFTTGAAQDLPALAELAHSHGALLAVDAYQATGLFPTDVARTGVDVYLSGTLKWLFGGSGTAFAWVRPELHEALLPTTTGWFSSARQFAFEVDRLAWADDGRRYEMGTPSVPSAAIARGGLAVVREIGIERLRQRTTDLGDLAIRLAEDAGLAVRAVRDPARRGGIVSVAASHPKPIVDGLAERDIIVDFRPGIVRISPAFYNTEDEVRLLIAALDELVPSADRRDQRPGHPRDDGSR